MLEHWRAEYEAKGFVLVPRVLAADHLGELRDECDRLAQTHGDTKPWDGQWRHDSPHADLQTRYTFLSVPHVHQHSRLWRAVAESGTMLGLVESLIGPAHLVAATLVVKPPETGQPFPLHQDSAFYGVGEHKYCIAVVHLDATNAENGALRFLPGVHTRGLQPHLRAGKAYLPTDQFRMEDTVEVPAEAGDVVFFDLHTPHASYQNRTQKPRVMVRLGYAARGFVG